MEFTELKTNEDVIKFMSHLVKLKVTELPQFKQQYEEIKRNGTITRESHEDTLCTIDHKDIDGEWNWTILGEKTKKDKNGESFRDVYYIDPQRPGVIYVEHRYLIDNDNPRRKSTLQECFPARQKEWEYLWRRDNKEEANNV